MNKTLFTVVSWYEPGINTPEGPAGKDCGFDYCNSGLYDRISGERSYSADIVTPNIRPIGHIPNILLSVFDSYVTGRTAGGRQPVKTYEEACRVFYEFLLDFYDVL